MLQQVTGACGTPAIEVQRYASNATYTVNLLHNVSGISYFNVLRGASNGLELVNFFEEATGQEDIDGNSVIKGMLLLWIIAVSIMEVMSSHIYVIWLKKGMLI